MNNSIPADDIILPSNFEDALSNSRGKPFVFTHEDMRTLHFDERFIQSAMSISEPNLLLLSYTRAMMAFLLFNSRPSHILMIGLGGGSLVKYCRSKLPTTRITVLEINHDIIALRDEFFIPNDDEYLRVIHVDAQQYLSTMSEKVDIILHDGYDAAGLSPSLRTEAFYRLCHTVLERDGMLVSDLWGETDDIALAMSRLHVVFGEKMWWCNASKSCNLIVFAAKNSTSEVVSIDILATRAIEADSSIALFFGELVNGMQTAFNKRCLNFELLVKGNMRATRRKESFGEAIETVFWSVGIRKDSDDERVIQQRNPIYVIIAAVIGMALFITTLIILIKAIVAH